MKFAPAIATGAVIAGGVVFAWWAASGDRDYYGNKLMSPKALEDVALVDQNNAPFQLSSLKGEAVFVSFGFTNCPDICPTTLNHLAAIAKLLPPGTARRTKFLFITIDPARDTPEKLKQYVPFFNSEFLGLTGSEQQIAHAAKQFGVIHEPQYQPKGDAANYYTMNHSTYLYLLDPQGRLAVLYHYEEIPEAKKIAEDATRLLDSSP